MAHEENLPKNNKNPSTHKRKTLPLTPGGNYDKNFWVTPFRIM
jgi:hypothetical protein